MEGSRQHRPARRLGGRRAAGARDALAAASAAKAYCARAARSVCETADPGARWHRQHLGLPGPRLPAPGPALERRARRGRPQPGPGARRPRHRRRRWTSVTRPTRRVPAAPARVAGRATTPGCPPSSTDDEYWAGQAAWHQSLYDAGFFGLSWPTRGRRARTAQRLRRDRRRGAGRGRRAAPAERRLPGPGDPASTAARTSSAASCPAS